MENMSPTMQFALVLMAGVILFALGAAAATWKGKAPPGEPVPTEEEKRKQIRRIAYDAFESAFLLYDAASLGTDKVIDEAVRITRERILASNLDDTDKAFWDEDKIRRAFSWLAELFVEKIPS